MPQIAIVIALHYVKVAVVVDELLVVVCIVTTYAQTGDSCNIF